MKFQGIKGTQKSSNLESTNYIVLFKLSLIDLFIMLIWPQIIKWKFYRKWKLLTSPGCVYYFGLTYELWNGDYTENANTWLCLSRKCNMLCQTVLHPHENMKGIDSQVTQFYAESGALSARERERAGVESRKKKRRYMYPHALVLNQWWVRPKTEQNFFIFLIKNWETGSLNFSPKLPTL